jgi:hypothetical protein
MTASVHHLPPRPPQPSPLDATVAILRIAGVTPAAIRAHGGHELAAAMERPS